MRNFVGLRAVRALGLALILAGCATAPTPRVGPPPTGAEAHALTPQTTLVVGLYPYVPRLDQFQAAITEAWAEARPDVALRFLSSDEWDGGYSQDPPSEADVYVFDAMFFDDFRSRSWLEPMSAGEIDELSDFVAYAIDGVEVDGRYYAIPQLGCGNILFFLKDDAQLAAADTLSEIEAALSTCTYTSEIPPDQRGLMIDMAGGTTNAGLYLDTVNSITGQVPPPLPWSPSQINPQAMSNMRRLLAMASYENGTSSLEEPYQRGTWFGRGWGRALVGYTEAMSAMGAQMRAEIGFKVMPLSDDDRSTMFFADVIGVNATTRGRGTRDLAVRLANVMASKATMVASIGPGAGNPYPQYLMATRPSIFHALGTSFPIYDRMYGLITSGNPAMFNLGDQARAWLAAMKDTLRTDAREEYPCGCDVQATEPIPDNAAAPSICNPTCADHGGWSGRWTNQPPAAPPGTAVCGCNACPVP